MGCLASKQAVENNRYISPEREIDVEDDKQENEIQNDEKATKENSSVKTFKSKDGKSETPSSYQEQGKDYPRSGEGDYKLEFERTLDHDLKFLKVYQIGIVKKSDAFRYTFWVPESQKTINDFINIYRIALFDFESEREFREFCQSNGWKNSKKKYYEFLRAVNQQDWRVLRSVITRYEIKCKISDCFESNLMQYRAYRFYHKKRNTVIQAFNYYLNSFEKSNQKYIRGNNNQLFEQDTILSDEEINESDLKYYTSRRPCGYVDYGSQNNNNINNENRNHSNNYLKYLFKNQISKKKLLFNGKTFIPISLNLDNQNEVVQLFYLNKSLTKNERLKLQSILINYKKSVNLNSDELMSQSKNSVLNKIIKQLSYNFNSSSFHHGVVISKIHSGHFDIVIIRVLDFDKIQTRFFRAVNKLNCSCRIIKQVQQSSTETNTYLAIKGFKEDILKLKVYLKNILMLTDSLEQNIL